MPVIIASKPFDPWSALADYEQTLTLLQGKMGAVATFVGTTRDFNASEQVKTLFIEHYAGMTEKYLQATTETAMQRWLIGECLIIHRVGTLQPGETIVLIAVWATHRHPAFASCQFLLETLKTKAPFWKCETLIDGNRRWLKGESF